MARKSRRDKALYASVRRKIRTRVKSAHARSLIRLRSLRKMKYGKYRVRHGKIVNVGSNPRRRSKRRNPSEKTVAMKMYEKGYRYQVRHPKIGAPLYVKTVQQGSNLLREVYPELSGVRIIPINSSGEAYGMRD